VQADGGGSARFSSIFLASSFFLLSNRVHVTAGRGQCKWLTRYFSAKNSDHSERMMKIAYTENSLASFEDFHDGDWIKQIAQLAKGTEIESIVEEFASHWWGSARAFILPWLLANGVYDGINTVVPLTISPQDVWNGYLEINGFHAALWKLSEGMYCSIYHAYENLLVNLLQKIKGKKLRVTDRDFTKLLIEVWLSGSSHGIPHIWGCLFSV